MTSITHPACVLTRDAAVSVLHAVTCAPITRTTRGIRSEIAIGREQGLPESCAITCDNSVTLPLDQFDAEPVGRLDEVKRADPDRALRYALDIFD